MTAPDPQTCEVKVDGAWVGVTLAEARAHHGPAPKRCPACHGRVSTAGNYTAAAQAGLKMVHAKAHDGCPLMPKHFVGRLRLHPEALA